MTSRPLRVGQVLPMVTSSLCLSCQSPSTPWIPSQPSICWPSTDGPVKYNPQLNSPYHAGYLLDVLFSRLSYLAIGGCAQLESCDKEELQRATWIRWLSGFSPFAG